MIRPLQNALVALVGLGLVAPTPALAEQVHVEATLDHQTLRADRPQRVWMRLGLRGFQRTRARQRAPMNVAIVIDKSRSMKGDKIVHAKAAARAATAALGADDVVSVVAYDSTVQVLVPATKARDRGAINAGIDRLTAGGMTALFAGTSKGAAEVRKFLSRGAINRVVLLSDGKANVGPSAPGDLARLGAGLRREGIGVTTVGMGLDYNEDLLAALSRKSGGQHFFTEHSRELAELFRRGFGGLGDMVAKEVVVELRFAEGFRPLRVLGVDGEVIGRTVRASLAQLYSAQSDDIVIELEAGPAAPGNRPVARIAVSYLNLDTGAVDRVETSVAATFAVGHAAATGSANPDVMVSVAAHLAALRSRQAITLRDAGQIDKAHAVLMENADYLKEHALRWGSDRLRELERYSRRDVDYLRDAQWFKRRKEMTQRNFDPVNPHRSNF